MTWGDGGLMALWTLALLAWSIRNGWRTYQAEDVFRRSLKLHTRSLGAIADNASVARENLEIARTNERLFREATAIAGLDCARPVDAAPEVRRAQLAYKRAVDVADESSR